MNSAQLINQNSSDVEYYTPSEILEAAHECMGGIDLDPASSARSNETVKALRWFGVEADGMFRTWDSRALWMNHPFGRAEEPCAEDCQKDHTHHSFPLYGNAAWINHLVKEYELGHAQQACNITFAATSEAWFQPLARRPQCYLSPRTNYYVVGPDGKLAKKPGVTKGSVVTYFGPNVDRFAKAFAKLGIVKIPYGYK